MDLSIIIPAKNEAEHIARCITAARETGAPQIIVVDGGSTDDTARIAADLGANVHTCAPGRARQMNEGAALATGNVLFFLHADCILPADCLRQIEHALTDRQIGGGAFRQRINASGLRYRLLERGNDARVRWLGMAYGDQGIFVRREVFERLGGFPDTPLLEDWLFSRQLRRAGRVVLLPGPLQTSARHWQARGVVRTTIRNWLILLAARLGVSPERLARHYHGHDA